MTISRARWAAALSASTIMGSAAADDVTGKDRFVCTSWRAISCSTEGACESTDAWRLNMPDFLKVDLRAMEMVTPEGTDEPRSTKIGSLARNAGRLFLNGSQDVRGFTWVINESTGEGRFVIVSDTTSITLFTACAPSDRLS